MSGKNKFPKNFIIRSNKCRILIIKLKSLYRFSQNEKQNSSFKSSIQIIFIAMKKRNMLVIITTWQRLEGKTIQVQTSIPAYTAGTEVELYSAFQSI